MSDSLMGASFFLGLFIPPLLGALRARWSKEWTESASYLITFAVCFLVASSVTLVDRHWTLEELIANAGVVFTSSQALYATLKASGAMDKIEGK